MSRDHSARLPPRPSSWPRIVRSATASPGRDDDARDLANTPVPGWKAIFFEEATHHGSQLRGTEIEHLVAPARQVAHPPIFEVRPDPRQAFENAYVKKMRIHCEGYIKNADALATDAEKFAEYHRLRAGELKGK